MSVFCDDEPTLDEYFNINIFYENSYARWVQRFFRKDKEIDEDEEYCVDLFI